MMVSNAGAVDLDAFYSEATIAEWQAIIGPNLHYHFGYFQEQKTLEDGLQDAVRRFYPWLPIGAHVLDLGCGWGGPARLLMADRNCTVQGVTISAAQAAYCRQLGLAVHHCNMETAPLDGTYDAIFMLEVLSHITDKRALLQRLRQVTPRLLLTVNCVANGYQGQRMAFGASMTLCSQAELVNDLEAAGWRIQFLENRRLQSLPTLLHWKQNLDQRYGTQPPPGQLAMLRGLTDTALAAVIPWCQAFPLIDIVAE